MQLWGPGLGNKPTTPHPPFLLLTFCPSLTLSVPQFPEWKRGASNPRLSEEPARLPRLLPHCRQATLTLLVSLANFLSRQLPKRPCLVAQALRPELPVVAPCGPHSDGADEEQAQP